MIERSTGAIAMQHHTNPACTVLVKEYVYGFYYRSHIDLYYALRSAR